MVGEKSIKLTGAILTHLKNERWKSNETFWGSFLSTLNCKHFLKAAKYQLEKHKIAFAWTLICLVLTEIAGGPPPSFVEGATL